MLNGLSESSASNVRDMGPELQIGSITWWMGSKFQIWPSIGCRIRESKDKMLATKALLQQFSAWRLERILRHFRHTSMPRCLFWAVVNRVAFPTVSGQWPSCEDEMTLSNDAWNSPFFESSCEKPSRPVNHTCTYLPWWRPSTHPPRHIHRGGRSSWSATCLITICGLDLVSLHWMGVGGVVLLNLDHISYIVYIYIYTVPVPYVCVYIIPVYVSVCKYIHYIYVCVCIYIYMCVCMCTVVKHG